MTTSGPISRHTSTVSLLPCYTSQEEILQAFSPVCEALETGLQRIIDAKTQKNHKIGMKMDEQAKKLLSDHIIKTVAYICLPTLPQKISDVDNKIKNGLPGFRIKFMPAASNLEEFRLNAEKGRKKQLMLPADKIYSVFKELYSRFDPSVSLYIVALLEYIISYFLQIAIDYEVAVTHSSVQPYIRGSALETLLFVCDKNVQPPSRAHLREFVASFPDDYDKCVKELHFFLNQCIDQMTLIVRLFRDPLSATFPNTGDLQTIFGNIVDLLNNTRILVNAIDDVFESQTRVVGTCFFDPAENDSLNGFCSYGETIFDVRCRARLGNLCENQELVNALGRFSRTTTQTIAAKSAGKRNSESEVRFLFHHCDWCNQTPDLPITDQMPGCNFMVNSYRYLLPRLLLLPVFYFLHLVEILQKLRKLTPDEDDGTFIAEVLSMLAKARTPLLRALESNEVVQAEVPRLSYFLRMQQSSAVNARLAKKKLDDMEKLIKRTPEDWEWPAGRFEFIMEGDIQVGFDNKKLAERYVYVFSTWMLLCKSGERRTPVSTGQPSSFIKVKKKISLELINMVDKSAADDPEDSRRLMFEMEYLDQKNATNPVVQKILFCAKTPEEKEDWMATLLTIQTQKIFAKYMRNLPKEEVPLRLPSPNKYRFAQADSELNIHFEDTIIENSADIPVIKCASLPKLIERITYHAYFDSKTLNSFLLVFRNFTTPEELLDLLIERFHIPDPDFTEEEERVSCDGIESPANHMLKRFRTTYKKRVQLRVLNVLINWVRNPEYFQTDFQNNESLRSRLSDFVETVEGRQLQDGVRTIKKHLRGEVARMTQTFNAPPPPVVDLGLVNHPSDVRLTNVHPLEFARQVTLYEWELYKNIEYWEVNAKEKTSYLTPNLLKSQEFSNRLKCWMVYSVMSQDNIEDRMAVIMRIADLMQIFEKLNNMQGAQEAKGALISASVFRLYHTHNAVIGKFRVYRSVFEQLRKHDINDMYTVQYQRKIRRINPPCVPFIAFGGTTHLIHNKLANQDFVSVGPPGSEVNLINFKKHRLAGEVVEHYMSFQKTPYNFTVEPTIREFLQGINPLRHVGVHDENAFDDYAFERSKFLEPKNVTADVLPVFERSLRPKEIRLAHQLNNMNIEEKLNEDQAQTIFMGSFDIGSSLSIGGSKRTLSLGGPKSPSHHTRAHSPPFSAFTGRSPTKNPSPDFDDDVLGASSPFVHGRRMGPAVARFGASPPDYTRFVPVHQHSVSDSVIVSRDPSQMGWEDSVPPPRPPRIPPRVRDSSRSSSQCSSGGEVSPFSSDLTDAPPAIPPRRYRACAHPAYWHGRVVSSLPRGLSHPGSVLCDDCAPPLPPKPTLRSVPPPPPPRLPRR